MTAADPLLELLASRAYRRGQFTLASGRSSEHYVNCKPVTLSGRGAQLLAPKLMALVEPNAAAVAGLTLGADPMVSWVAHAAALSGRELDALIVRKEAKGHGTGAWLEGPLPEPGERITLLEDVVTSGGSAKQGTASDFNAQLAEAAKVQSEGMAISEGLAILVARPSQR